MMKHIFCISLMLLHVFAYAYPIKSSLSSKNTFDEPKPAYNPYITDGLVAMFDGEWNIGFGKHSDTTEVWVNLVDRYALAIDGKVVGENFVRFTSSS